MYTFGVALGPQKTFINVREIQSPNQTPMQYELNVPMNGIRVAMKAIAKVI